VLFPIRDHNPRTRFPAVTLLLVAANVVAWLYLWQLDQASQQWLVLAAGAIPYEIVHHVDLPPRDLFPLPGSIWTSMFLHGGWLHLIGNMWFLWLFGDNVEEALGSVRYLIFYFLVGTVGALAQSYAMPSSTAPMIGASGAVAGALGGYVMLYPRARIDTLITIPFLWPVVLRAVPAAEQLGRRLDGPRGRVPRRPRVGAPPCPDAPAAAVEGGGAGGVPAAARQTLLKARQVRRSRTDLTATGSRARSRAVRRAFPAPGAAD